MYDSRKEVVAESALIMRNGKASAPRYGINFNEGIRAIESISSRSHVYCLRSTY